MVKMSCYYDRAAPIGGTSSFCTKEILKGSHRTDYGDVNIIWNENFLSTESEMLKIETYIAPLFMSYVDKYIKNLKPSDLSLSLWGGDVVLYNLDLRLDVLEKVTVILSYIHDDIVAIIIVAFSHLYFHVRKVTKVPIPAAQRTRFN